MFRGDKKEGFSNAIDPTSLILPNHFSALVEQCNTFRNSEFQRLSTFNYKQLQDIIKASFDKIEKDSTSKDTTTIIRTCYIVDCLRELCPERLLELINITSKFSPMRNIDVEILKSYVTSKLYNEFDGSENLKNKLSLMYNSFNDQEASIYFLYYLVQYSPKAVLLNIQKQLFINIILKAFSSENKKIQEISVETLRKYIDIIKILPEISVDNNIHPFGQLLFFSVLLEKGQYQLFSNYKKNFHMFNSCSDAQDQYIKWQAIYCLILLGLQHRRYFYENHFHKVLRFFEDEKSGIQKVYACSFLLLAQNFYPYFPREYKGWRIFMQRTYNVQSSDEEVFQVLQILVDNGKLKPAEVYSKIISLPFTSNYAKCVPKLINSLDSNSENLEKSISSFCSKIYRNLSQKPTVDVLSLIAACKPLNNDQIHSILMTLLDYEDREIRANAPFAILQNAKNMKNLPDIVDKLLIHTLSEIDSFVRAKTISAFPESMTSLLSSVTSVNCFETLVNDESYEVRKQVMIQLGRIVKFSSFSVLPILRRVLLDDLFLLNSQRSHNMQKEMAKLLLYLISSAEGILPIYAQSICQIALEHFNTTPKREQTIFERESFFDISMSLCKVVNIIAQKDINMIYQDFNKFIESFMNILKQHNKKELKIAIVEALTTFISKCGNQFKIDRKKMFTELTAIASKWKSVKLNLQFLKLFGLLGAVDNQSDNTENNEIDINDQKLALADDTEEIGIDHHQYCQKIACKTLLGVLEDNSLNAHHLETTLRLVDLFLLHEESTFEWYYKFMPLFLNEIRTTRLPKLLKLLQYLCKTLPASWLTCFTDELISMIYELWTSGQLLHVLDVVFALASVLNNRFAPFLPQCITLLLDCLFSNRSTNKEVCFNVLESLLALRFVESDYMFLIIPEIIAAASNELTKIETRVDSLDALRIFIQSCECEKYSASIVRCVKICLVNSGPIRDMALQVLYSLQVCLGLKFVSYQCLFNDLMAKDENFRHISAATPPYTYKSFEFINTSDRIRNDSRVIDINQSDAKQKMIAQRSSQQQLDQQNIAKKFQMQEEEINFTEQTPGGLKEWFKNYVEFFIENSPEKCISLALPLSKVLPNVSESLFNVAFLSCWEIMNEEERNKRRAVIINALKAQNLSESTRSLLVNLIEFMDRAEMSIGISPELLCEKCLEFGHNARAFYFAEKWFTASNDINSLENMIKIASQLGLKQTAIGLAKTVKNETSISPKMRQQLGDWEIALQSYDSILATIQPDDPIYEENLAGKLCCMQHFLMWSEIVDFLPEFKRMITTPKNKNKSHSRTSTSHSQHNTPVHLNETEVNKADQMNPNKNAIAASLIEALINLNKYDEISFILQFCNEYDTSSYIFAAIAQFKLGNKEEAEKIIEKAFDNLAQKAHTMFKHDKSMIYPTVLESMKLTELSEIINDRVNPTVWVDRLALCRKEFDATYSIMSVRMIYENTIDQSLLLLKRALKTQNWRLFKEVENQYFTEEQRKSSQEFKLIDAMGKWESGQQAEAFQQIMSLSINTDNANQTIKFDNTVQMKEMDEKDEAARNRKLASKISFLRGQWLLRMTPPNEVDSVIDTVIPHLVLATNLDAQNYKAWHRWSWVCANIFNDDNAKTSAAIEAISGFMQCVRLRADSAFSDLLQMISIFFVANLDDDSFREVSSLISSLDDAFILRISQQLIAQINTSNTRISQFILELIKSRLPRLYHVLLYPLLLIKRNNDKSARSKPRPTTRAASNVDSIKYTPPTSPIIKSLSSDVSKIIPTPQSAATRSTTTFDIVNDLLESFRLLNPDAVREAEIVSDGLLKASYLRIERRMNLIIRLSKLMQRRKYQRMLEIVSNELDEPVVNNDDKNFELKYGIDFKLILNSLRILIQKTDVKEYNKLVTNMKNIFAKYKTEVSKMHSLKLSDVAPELAELNNCILAVPGTYNAHYANRKDETETENGQHSSSDVIAISSFSPVLEVIASKQNPRLVVIIGSDGFQHTSLLKGQEDLRLDEHVMQFFDLINMHIMNTFPSNQRHLRVHTYAITPLSSMSGLIQFIDNTDTLYKLVVSYREQRNIMPRLEDEIAKECFQPFQSMTSIERLEFLRQLNSYKGPEDNELFNLPKTAPNSPLVTVLSGNDLKEVIWLKSGNSNAWISRTSRFTATSAVISIIGYILGLGDRHPSNIMMHRLSGDVIHIDLGDCFEVGMMRSNFPEKVPFRATRMLRNAFGPSGVDGIFRITCQQTMKLVRGHRESIMSVLNIFLQDPLEGTISNDSARKAYNRSLSDANKTNSKGNDMDEIQSMNLDIDNNQSVSESVESEVDLGSEDELVKLDIEKALDRITDKIMGLDFDKNVELKVEEQVAKLIDSAQDEYNLANMYPPWLPFW